MFSGVAALGRTLNAGSGRELCGNSAGAGTVRQSRTAYLRGTNSHIPLSAVLVHWQMPHKVSALSARFASYWCSQNDQAGSILILECRNGPTGVVRHLGFV